LVRGPAEKKKEKKRTPTKGEKEGKGEMGGQPPQSIRQFPATMPPDAEGGRKKKKLIQKKKTEGGGEKA